MLKQAFAVVYALLLLRASVLAFHPEHPEDFTSDAALQCVVCNASYYCKNGERYACGGNSTAIQYADKIEECICNPGYIQPPKPPPTLQFFFRTDEGPYSWQEAYNEALAAGRRLPTIDELRA